MHSGVLLSRFALHKAEYVGPVGFIMQEDLAKSAGMSFKQLLLSSFNEIQLDMTIDRLSTIWAGNTEKGSPVLSRGQHVADDLILF